nr:spore coat protein [Metabacillus flavus]
MPLYGLQKGTPLKPLNADEAGDKELSACILGIHKSSAQLRSMTVIECTNEPIRRSLLDSARNCAEMATELFTYMNRKGYQVANPNKNTEGRLHGQHHFPHSPTKIPALCAGISFF